MTNYIIATNSLNYFFAKDVQTLHNINLQVPAGSVYGFLGPNGAGKTTTLRLLLGLLRKQEGSIHFFGKEFEPARLEVLRRLGSLIEQPSLYGHLTAKENLEVYRKIYGVPKERITTVLSMVGLSATGSKKTKQFSLGMKQRLSIAVALLHSPEILILDEPTNGLDPNGIIETRELIKKLNKEEGVTVLVSSHILAEIERMASHVGIIHGGKLLFQGPIGELHKMQKTATLLQLETSDNEQAFQLLQPRYKVHQQDGHLLLPFDGKEEAGRINRSLLQNGIEVYHLHVQQNDLEKLFLDITAN